MASSGGVKEPLPYFRLLPIVSYVVDSIYFNEISITFFNLKTFLFYFCQLSAYSQQIQVNFFFI